MSNNPNKYGYAVDKNRDGYWIRNDGFTFDNAMNIQKYFNKTIKIEVEEAVGGFYVNRLQNLGYNKNDFLSSQFTSYKDKQIHSVTSSDIAHKETILMNKYKQRLMVL